MKAKRIYKGSDIKMLKAVTDVLFHFEGNLADFTAVDPSLNNDFLNEWNALREVVWSEGGDFVEVIQGEILLEEAVTVLERCRAKYKEVKYFAGKAFPKNKEALKEFGEGQYKKVLTSPLRMVQFMETLYGVATKYKTQLIAKDYTQAAIDEIDALATELRADNKSQQLKKKERPMQTRNRIELLNKFYGFGQQVAIVAPVVFAGSLRMRKYFLLTAPGHSKTAKTWLELKAGGVRKISITGLHKKFTLTVTNQSNEAVQYWQANNLKETPALKQPLSAGDTLSAEASEPVKKFLVMQNNSTAPVRLMMVKEEIEKQEPA